MGGLVVCDLQMKDMQAAAGLPPEAQASQETFIRAVDMWCNLPSPEKNRFKAEFKVLESYVSSRTCVL